MDAADTDEAGLLERLWPRPLGGNEVVLLQSGAEFFPALVAAIDAAERIVRLETYIFSGDDAGLRVAGALARAAERGVDVRLMIDGFGTRELPPGIAKRLARAGVQVGVYAPMPRHFTLDRTRLRRLHRKQAAIDGRIAFVGGINVLDDLWDPNHGALEHPRLDYAVRLGGPVAASVDAAMSRLWWQVAVARAPLRAAGVARPRVGASAGADGAAAARLRTGMRAMLVLRDNIANRRAIERAYLKALGGARREVLIANAYFFPGRRFRRALVEAARRGVRVRLLLQGRAEYVLPHLATQALYDPLLRAGVEIVEYHRSFLHAKVAVIDDWATVGSSNIDPFSLLLAREANVMVIDAGFAATLRDRLLASMAEGGRPVLHDELARRPWTRRLAGWFATQMLRLGVMVSGHRQRY
ncbi:MAG: cardiolipin synthase ClsB [Burkholderiales bacterium]|nr:MAG: cardiolipin synthase ClsB [Burkholderiales bacterium]